MQKLILHIPHSSACLPNLEGYLLSENQLNNEILKLTDWYTDELFDGTDEIKIIANFSRIFCDVERFADDTQEVMAQYGMGVLYTSTDSGTPMRTVSDNLRSEILKNFYWTHHATLTEAVNRQLAECGTALIVDCHSYSNKPFKRDLNQDADRPDFCIGTDSFHTPAILIEESIEFFNEKGFSVGINVPYAGSIVPMEHYMLNQDVKSIMLEINRNLYLVEGTNERNANFSKTKRIVTEYLQLIRKFSI